MTCHHQRDRRDLHDQAEVANPARFEAAGIPGPGATELATTLVASLEGGFMLARSARDTGPLLAIGRAIRSLVEATLAQTARGMVDNISGSA